MSKFHMITMEDQAWLTPILMNQTKRSCEYSFGNLYTWRDVSCVHVLPFEGGALVRFDCDYACYLFPIGCADLPRAIEAIEEDAAVTGHRFLIAVCSEEECRAVEAAFPGVYRLEETPAYGEYIYRSSDLAGLAGKHYHQKRNFIARFEAEYPDARLVTLTGADEARMLAMNEAWYAERTAGTQPPKSIVHEHLAVIEAIRHMEPLGFSAGGIEVGGRLIAFSLGEPIQNDTFCVHIEKAFTNYVGSYAIINREFVRAFGKDYLYINREDAAGIEGLIKAKQSYYPVEVTRKFVITRRESA